MGIYLPNKWFAGRSLDPSGSVGGDGNGPRANNVRPYRMCTLICRVQRPRCPVRSLCCRPMRADIESAPTVGYCCWPCGCWWQFIVSPSGASRTPPPTYVFYHAINDKGHHYSKQLRRDQDPSLQYRPLKPPLCKGRWHGAAVTEGLKR